MQIFMFTLIGSVSEDYVTFFIHLKRYKRVADKDSFHIRQSTVISQVTDQVILPSGKIIKSYVLQFTSQLITSKTFP